MVMEMELKHCPFCGSEKVMLKYYYVDYLENETRHYISCDFCRAMGPSHESLTETITRWNNRFEDEN